MSRLALASRAGLSLLLACTAGCGEGTDGTPGGSGGGASGGQAGSAAAGSSGNAAGGSGSGSGGSTGGQGGGLAGSTGGANPQGGASAGGSAGSATGGLGGQGGASGGAAGSAGSAGSGGSSPMGSSGCGKASPATGALSAMVSGNQAAYHVTLPDGYDPSVPVPLVFGFHGRGRTHDEFRTVDASEIQTELGGSAVMAYLKSQGGTGWEQSGERELNVDFYETVYEKMLADYCIDTSKIFAVGHSSGAHFAHILACRFGDDLRGIGVVAGYHPEATCTGKVAAMIVHGTMDNQVNYSSGQEARDFYLDQNGCGDGTAAGEVSPCVEYQGCEAEHPVQWCAHTEPTYQNTNHGWPSFASEAMAKFFWALP